jgi:hypothetical protein
MYSGVEWSSRRYGQGREMAGAPVVSELVEERWWRRMGDGSTGKWLRAPVVRLTSTVGVKAELGEAALGPGDRQRQLASMGPRW